MSRLRFLAGVVWFAATLVAPAFPGWPQVHALSAPAPAPMSWWGYWVGRKGDTKPGFKFLRRGQAEPYGNNIVLVHAGRDPKELTMLRRGFNAVRAKGQQVGVILMLDNLLRKQPGDPPDYGPCFYGAVHYDGWHARLSALSAELHRPNADGWRPVDSIIAIAGLDEVNGFASLCFQPAPGAPHPIPYAMELAALYFPEVPDRGHVWTLGPNPVTQAPPTAVTLEGSTLPFAYHYASYIGPFSPTTVPVCPQEGMYPNGDLSDGSFAALDEFRLQEFVANVNAIRGTTDTPVAFIPYSNRIGNHPTEESSRGTACTLATLWFHMRCLAATEPTGWAAQVRGFVAWQWDRERDVFDPVTGDLLLGWTGTQRNPILRDTGKWIGRNRAAPACLPTD